MLRILLAWCCAVGAIAEEFPVTIGSSAYSMMPGLAERVADALNEQGLNATLTVLPGDRAFHQLSHGLVALDIIRHPNVMKDEAQVIQIPQPVVSVRMVRIVPAAFPENCDRTDADLKVIGIRGIRAFKGTIVPKFNAIVWAQNEETALRMLSGNRGDLSYWVEGQLDQIDPAYNNTILVCEDNAVTFELFSYLHTDYSWAEPAVNAAYSLAFPPK